jgi:hypothetical protein
MRGDLTERQVEILGDLASIARRDPTFWARPLDLGGTDSSHHGATLRRLAARGLVDQRNVPGIANIGRRRTNRYRINDAGRAALETALATDRPQDQ